MAHNANERQVFLHDESRLDIILRFATHLAGNRQRFNPNDAYGTPLNHDVVGLVNLLAGDDNGSPHTYVDARGTRRRFTPKRTLRDIDTLRSLGCIRIVIDQSGDFLVVPLCESVDAAPPKPSPLRDDEWATLGAVLDAILDMNCGLSPCYIQDESRLDLVDVLPDLDRGQIEDAVSRLDDLGAVFIGRGGQIAPCVVGLKDLAGAA